MKSEDRSTSEYITLKEAAKISGYSPDYIGQLIRKGKIPGRQIYTNIAWVTTEESIREYLEREGKGKKVTDDSSEVQEEHGELVGTFSDESSAQLTQSFFSTERMIRWLLYLALLLVVLCAFVLFFVFAVSIDNKASLEHYRTTVEGGKQLTVQGKQLNTYAKR